jgi:hypothetical protein
VNIVFNLSEAGIKNSCESFLAALQNMDRLIYLRLNSGDLIIGEGVAKRRVRCCPKGTSDGMVILPNPTHVVFVEYKRSIGGKQTREQATFEKSVERQGHEYWLVSDIDAFQSAIGELIERKDAETKRERKVTKGASVGAV